MVHDALLCFHILGMAFVVGSSLFLLFANPGVGSRNKAAVFLVGAAHTQFLTGLILFLIDITEINPTKYGVKTILVIVLIVLGTIYRKRLKEGKATLAFLLPTIVILSLLITGIAFYWK